MRRHVAIQATFIEEYKGKILVGIPDGGEKSAFIYLTKEQYKPVIPVKDWSPALAAIVSILGLIASMQIYVETKDMFSSLCVFFAATAGSLAYAILARGVVNEDARDSLDNVEVFSTVAFHDKFYKNKLRNIGVCPECGWETDLDVEDAPGDCVKCKTPLKLVKRFDK